MYYSTLYEKERPLSLSLARLLDSENAPALPLLATSLEKEGSSRARVPYDNNTPDNSLNNNNSKKNLS